MHVFACKRMQHLVMKMDFWHCDDDRSGELEARGAPAGRGLRRADGDPEQGDGDGDEARPDEDDGGRLAAAAHEPLGEGVEVRQHPKAEEAAADELAPPRVVAVDGAREGEGDGDDVDHADGDGRDEQRGPLDHVEVGIDVLVVVRRRLGREREGDLDPGHHLEQALHHRVQVRAGACKQTCIVVSMLLAGRRGLTTTMNVT